MPEKVEFTKYHGLGNDFVLLENRVITAEFAKGLCTRRFGVGADGVIVIDTDAKVPRIKIWNRDGSIAEMCGNGIRCVADYLQREKLVDDDEFEIETDAGTHEVAVHKDGNVDVWMRAYSTLPQDIGLKSEEPWVGKTFNFEDASITLTAISMGNPHVVTFDDVDVAAWAERIAGLPHFSHSANVGFAQMIDDVLELRVFERGVGWTLACGTGACAAAAAAVETGRWEKGKALTVRLPGGDLEIEVTGKDEKVRMRGPATLVYAGHFSY